MNYNEYLKECFAAKTVPPYAKKSYEVILDRICETFDGADETDYSNIQKISSLFFEERMSRSSFQKRKRALLDLYEFLNKINVVDDEIIAFIQRISLEDAMASAVQPLLFSNFDEMIRYMSLINAQAAPAMCIAILSWYGLSIREIANLRMDELDFLNGRVRCHNEQESKEYLIPMEHIENLIGLASKTSFQISDGRTYQYTPSDFVVKLRNANRPSEVAIRLIVHRFNEAARSAGFTKRISPVYLGINRVLCDLRKYATDTERRAYLFECHYDFQRVSEIMSIYNAWTSD